jgi:phospholipase A1
VELKFQFSFKQQIYDGLYFAYTQKSFWRVLDQEESRPFRETNFNPALFYRLLRPAPSWGAWGGDLGIEHESNGTREPTSRNWNRVYLAPFVEYGRLRAELKLWRRLSEEAKKTPEDTSGDENPDISDFYGYGELRLAYVNRWQHRAAMMARWNFATDNGAVQLDYSVPTGTKNLFIYGQFWSGYGESLIDYNRSITRYGIGVLIRQ